MRHDRGARFLCVVVAAAAVLLLAGCMGGPGPSPSPSGSSSSSASGKVRVMTPEEARQEVLDLYEPTKELVGGNWVEAMSTWDQCTTASNADGVLFNFLSVRGQQPLQAAPDVVATQTQGLWAKRGHAVKVVQDKTLDPPRWILSDPAWLSGSGPDGLLLQFMVGTDYANFRATSRCVPGDIAKVNGED